MLLRILCLLTCAHSDTVTRSGVFCTLYNAVQQCKAENMVDIYQLLKALRTQKPALVPNKVRYTYDHITSNFVMMFDVCHDL